MLSRLSVHLRVLCNVEVRFQYTGGCTVTLTYMISIFEGVQ